MRRRTFIHWALKLAKAHHGPGPWFAVGGHPEVAIHNADGRRCCAVCTTTGFDDIPESERGEFVANTIIDLQRPKPSKRLDSLADPRGHGMYGKVSASAGPVFHYGIDEEESK